MYEAPGPRSSTGNQHCWRTGTSGPRALLRAKHWLYTPSPHENGPTGLAMMKNDKKENSVSKLIKFSWEVFWKVGYIKVMHTCPKHFIKRIPHSTFGNKPRGQSFTSLHPLPLCLGISFSTVSFAKRPLPNTAEDRGPATSEMVLLWCSVGILITGRSLERNHAV